MEGVSYLWTLAHLRRELSCRLVPQPHHARARYPKPIRTGTTIHSLAITHGNLALYKVHVRVFSGATDGDLGKPNENTITTQKWVNLLLLMPNNFKNYGHCITIDSAYMGNNIMAMIGRDVWRINIMVTAQANHTGANIDCK